MIQSEREAHWGPYTHREHRYVGGPPPKRIKAIQIAHELRARKAGVPWDMIDLRIVYANAGGVCGICLLPVSLEETSFDHIVPLSKGGPHLYENVQPAHWACNVRKGRR